MLSIRPAYLLGLIFLMQSFFFSADAQQHSEQARVDYYGSEGIAIQNFSDLKDKLRQKLRLDKDYDFELIRQDKDALGMEHFRLATLYLGIPVKGSSYIAHLANGKLVLGNGNHLQEIKGILYQSIQANQALEIALEAINARVYKWEIAAEEIQLQEQYNDPHKTYFPQAQVIWFPLDQQKYRLAYHFDIYAQQPYSRTAVYVDAENGQILAKDSRLHYCDEIVAANTQFSGMQEITVTNADPNYTLDDCTRGDGIRTYDASIDLANPFSQAITDWEALAGTAQQANIDAHFGAAKVYDYLKNVHDRNSIDDNGLALISNVNADLGGSYNGLWDGDKMVYSPGNSNLPPPTSLTVCGHEITHGLVQYTANLIDGLAARALNESFADLFAVFNDSYTFPDIPNDSIYLVGEELIPGGLRSIHSPATFSTPSTFEGQFWDENSVYHMSMVHSHAYYILAEGKTGTNDNGDEYKVEGIGKEKASQIAYRTLSVYLTSSSGFSDASFFALKAAEDLFGLCSFEYKQTENAWYAVGLAEASTCATTGTSNLANSYSQFQISPNPAHSYFNLNIQPTGNWPATLAVYNSIGQVVYQTDQVKNTMRVDNLEDWPAGIYWVAIVVGQDLFSQRIFIGL